MKPENLTAVYIYIYIWTNLINKSTVGADLVSAQDKTTTNLPKTGLFVEEKVFLANNKVRDG